MQAVYANNALGQLAATITTVSTTIILQSRQGSLFTNPASGQYFYAVLFNATQFEIVKITGISADMLTVVRGQQGTSAQNFTIGDTLEQRLTAADLANFVQVSDPVFTAPLVAPNATANNELMTLGQGDGLFALIAGNPTQTFEAANSSPATQQVIPRSQADTLYAPSAGLATQTFEVANSAASTNEAVPRAQADTLYADATTTAHLNEIQTFTKTQSAKIQTVPYAPTIALDLTLGNDVAVGPLTGNMTLENPTTMTPGTSGHIAVTQDSTGGRTITFGSYWKFGINGVPPLSTSPAATDIIVYWVLDSTHIIVSILQGVQ